MVEEGPCSSSGSVVSVQGLLLRDTDAGLEWKAQGSAVVSQYEGKLLNVGFTVSVGCCLVGSRYNPILEKFCGKCVQPNGPAANWCPSCATVHSIHGRSSTHHACHPRGWAAPGAAGYSVCPRSAEWHVGFGFSVWLLSKRSKHQQRSSV